MFGTSEMPAWFRPVVGRPLSAWNIGHSTSRSALEIEMMSAPQARS
jgi:hypothetical protein